MPTFTSEENASFKALFEQADEESIGVLMGDKAVDLFAKANLPVSTLGEIWQIADEENNGFLTLERFKIALRLIGHAQQGESVSKSLIERAGPQPVLKGITSAQAPKQIAIPKVSVEDKTKFLRMFMASGPSNGMLEGEKARDIFMKSNLPVVQLGAIWNLADTKNRGSLDATDFIIGMHFIQLAMENNLPTSGVPQTLPPGLYDSAVVAGPNNALASSTASAHGSPARTGTPNRGMSGILKPQSTGERPIAKQHTGQKVAFSGFAPDTPPATQQSPAAASAFFRPQQQQPAQNMQWDIQGPEKARADGFFDSLDTSRRGFIEGEQAVPFFMESKLPETTLATIWDLSDIKSEGRLTKDEFAVAMRLINDQLDGKPLPNALPPSLVPPYLRSGNSQPAVQAPFARSAPTGPQQDLFSLMDEPDEVPATVSSPPAAQSYNAAPLSPQSTANSFKNAGPSLGGVGTSKSMALSPQNTGNSVTNRSLSPQPQQKPKTQQFATRSGGLDDFLGDADENVSNDSIQLGQMRNELNASQRGVSTLSAQRKEMETSAADVQREIDEMKEKLKASRDTFESEQKLVNELSIRAGDHKKELSKAREEVIRAESDLSALKDEKRELEGNLLRDKEEIRALKTRLAEHAKDTSALKNDIERLKKEGRQQKGMLAISKKQVSTAEGEKERLTAEAEGLRAAPQLDIAAVEQAATVPLPRSAIASPTGSVRSNNPFDRYMQQRSFTPDQMPPISAVPVAPAVPVAQAEQLIAPSSDAQGQASSSADPFGSESDPFSQASAGQTAALTDVAAPAYKTNASFDDDFEAAMSGAPAASTAAQMPASNSRAIPHNFDDEFEQLNEPASLEQPSADRSVRPAGAQATDRQPSSSDSSPSLNGQEHQVLASPRQADTESSDDEDDQGPEDPEGYRQPTPSLPGAYDGSDRAGSPISNTRNGAGKLLPHSSTKRVSVTSSADNDAFEDAQQHPAEGSGSTSGNAGMPPGYASAPLGGVETSHPTESAPKAATDDFDDFEKEFVNLSPTNALSSSQNFPPVSSSSSQPQHNQAVSDSFDDEFGMDDFQNDFGSAFNAKPAAESRPAASSAQQASFDDAFDDAFAPTSITANATQGTAGRDLQTASKMPEPVTSPPATSAPSQPAPTPAATDDIAAVKTLCSMGFSRTAAIESLEQYDYNVDRALNALLAKA